MKKLFLTLAATALCATGFAGTRVLYQQNFETASDVAATGWTYGGGSISIASDEYGKYLELSQGQNNGRSGYVQWGSDIFLDANGESVLEDGTYHVEFDFSIAQNSNNQYNSEITLFTNELGIANQPYRGRWSDPIGPYNSFLFDAYQCNTAADTDMLVAINAPYNETVAEDGTVSYSVDTTDQSTLITGEWYTVSLDVNVNTRVVEYQVESLTGTILKSGTYTVPETNLGTAEGTEVSMYAEGLWVMVARYNTIMDFDNIVISFDSSVDTANAPTIALKSVGVDANEEVNLNMRAYSITFLPGETLHLTGTDGTAEEVEYDDCDGLYVYYTETSGTIKAYTTCGTATSDVVEVEVECVPCVLPAAEVTITSVEAGYGKTYKLSVDNSEVPTQPTIFINYVFNSANGDVLSGENLASGESITLTDAGTLTLTTASFGFQSTTTTVQNNILFKVKNEWDFARMSDEEIKAAGFTNWQVLNSATTSGFSNWTARKRLYYYDSATATVDEESGETVYTAVYPFGYISDDDTVNVLDYSEIGTEGDDLGINVADYELFPGITVFAGHNVTYLKHLGVTNNATSGGNYKNIVVLNVDPTDFIVANLISSYGSNSNHPIVATTEEYYGLLEGEDSVYLPEQVTETVGEGDDATEVGTGVYNVTVPVYRIDTVCTKLTVYAQDPDAVEGVQATEVAGDNYYYTIDGLRLAQPTRPGLYIHNGKKIIVK